MNKVNPFPALMAPAPLVAITPCSLIFLSNLSNADKVAFVANLGRAFLTKETARSNNVFCPNYSSDYLTFYFEVLLIERF